MKIIAINGGPRKNGNTAVLLNKALEGAASKGAEIEIINLYDLNFKGCISCFACKLKDGKSYGKCAFNDDLKAVLAKVEEADAVIIGSPIYFGNITGMLRSFMERLMFQYPIYDSGAQAFYKNIKPVGMIYTMNVNQSQVIDFGYINHINDIEMKMKRFFGASESLIVTDTYQFDDYSRYVATIFDEQAKAKRREEEFPKDCGKAFDMGVRLAMQ